MSNQEDDKFKLLGRVLFMVLFILVICAHFDRSEKQFYFSTQYELITEMHSISNNAACIDLIQTSFLQKSLITLNDNTGFTLFNQNFKISSDNNRISQRIILLEKSLLSLKPISNCRYQHHLFPIDTEEPFI